MEKINASMSVSQVLDMDDNIHQVFLRHGFNCVGCPGATAESLEESAKGHMVDLKKLLSDLNQYSESK